MPDEWLIVGRKGRARKGPPAVSTLTCTTDSSNSIAGPVWSTQHGQAEPAGHATTASLHRLRQKIDCSLRDLQKSDFLRNFQRVWAHSQDKYLEQDESEHSSHPDLFSTKTATELVVYGLGSPSAGVDLASAAVDQLADSKSHSCHAKYQSLH